MTLIKWAKIMQGNIQAEYHKIHTAISERKAVLS